MDEIPAHCPVCDQQVLARRHPPSHVLHLLLTLVTAGLWLVVWLWRATSSYALTYFCPFCGTPVRTPTPSAFGLARTIGHRQKTSPPVDDPWIILKGTACPACGFENDAQRARRCRRCGVDLDVEGP